MAKFAKPLPPSSGEILRAPAADAEERRREEQLWIAVCLPGLALQALEPARAADRRPTIVVEALRGRLRVVGLNDAARSRGIRPGLDLNAAFGFSGSLRVIERSERAEKVLLEALAAACHRFTPSVSLELPESLLLEVRASLALFGGLERLRRALGEEIVGRAPDFRSSAAPTPLAALWLARGEGGDALAPDEIPSRVARLPLHVTRWPDTVRDLLEGMGVATIGECLRLPRGGFARRAGPRYLEELDKALGRRADLRAGFETPQHLSFEIELGGESTNVPVFVDAVTRMTERLTSELRLRQSQVRRMRLVFRHLRQAPSVHRLELLDSTCDRQRLLDLLCDKLERTALTAPATAVRLEAGPLEAAVLPSGRLFKGEGDADAGNETRGRLVERLRGRLGDEAVHGLAPAADHRPERAWVRKEAMPGKRSRSAHRPAAGTAVPGGRPARAPERRAVEPDVMSCEPMSPWAHERPLWLSPAPQPLSCVDGKPHVDDGALRLLEGPERIESGWWDGEGVARDYFVALAPGGERLWVYRDRVSRHWYLHGAFG